jgi:hypothetical protein
MALAGWLSCVWNDYRTYVHVHVGGGHSTETMYDYYTAWPLLTYYRH